MTRCTLFTADLNRSITPLVPKPPPCLVDYGELVQAILSRQVICSKDASPVLDGTEVCSVAPGEQFVQAKLSDGSTRASRLLVLATGVGSPLLRQVGLAAEIGEKIGVWTARYRSPAVGQNDAGRVDFVLGVGPKSGLGFRMVAGGFTTLGVCVDGPKRTALAELTELSRRFFKAGLLTADWERFAPEAVVRWSPAGSCLEMENHVSKRTLVVGHAGGFVAAYSNEGLYPAMWSAQLACRVVVEALRSSNPQDKLRQFDQHWRMSMAEHLRSPNADPQSIMPLVISNQQMADKMSRALFLGNNF